MAAGWRGATQTSPRKFQTPPTAGTGGDPKATTAPPTLRRLWVSGEPGCGGISSSGSPSECQDPAELGPGRPACSTCPGNPMAESGTRPRRLSPLPGPPQPPTHTFFILVSKSMAAVRQQGLPPPVRDLTSRLRWPPLGPGTEGPAGDSGAVVSATRTAPSNFRREVEVGCRQARCGGGGGRGGDREQREPSSQWQAGSGGPRPITERRTHLRGQGEGRGRVRGGVLRGAPGHPSPGCGLELGS